MHVFPFRRMPRLVAAAAGGLVSLLALTASLPAQQDVDPVRAALAALGAVDVTSLRFEGFGATYDTAPVPVRTPLPHYQGGIDGAPHGFLQAALAHHAVMRRLPAGTEVGFAADGRRFVGILDRRHLLDRVRTWVHDPVDGYVLVETFYRDYERIDGAIFPRHIIQDRAYQPALDVWVSSVDLDRPTLRSLLSGLGRHDKETR